MKRLDEIIKRNLEELNNGSIKCESNYYCIANVDHMIDFVKINGFWVYPEDVSVHVSKMGDDFIQNKTTAVFITTQNNKRIVIDKFKFEGNNIYSIRPILNLCNKLGMNTKTS